MAPEGARPMSNDKPPQVSKAPPPIKPLSGSRYSPSKPARPPALPPHWSDLLYESAAPWELAALSLNIDPKRINRNGLGTFPGDDTFARFQSIERAVVQRFKAYNDKPVNIAEFVAWAVSKNIDIPAELRAIRSEHDVPSVSAPKESAASKDAPSEIEFNPAPNGVTVTLPHMTAALEAAFKVMRENWQDFDPKRMPKQGNIGHEIDNAMGDIKGWTTQGDGTPSRNAKVVAAIIKPDGTPDE
jgi:hypothetical protein